MANACHWILAVVFPEDDSRARGSRPGELGLDPAPSPQPAGPDKTVKRGIKTKRLKAALNDRYLLKILRI
jgi:hypothetical protein